MHDGEIKVSDEPTRLAKLVSHIFQDSKPARAPQSSVELREGVSAQDDCAVFLMRGDQDLVVGSDYVRGPKFRLYEYGLLSNFDLGYYLVAANVSDVAAMGARPIGLLTVVRYPADMSDAEFADVLQGIRAACDEFRTPSVGGDIGGAERLILSATALGVCSSGRSLLRRGARVGDALCVTGPTGTAGAAMQYFRCGRQSAYIEHEYRELLLSSWRTPVARVREGICLGESGIVTSCQDTSDGLKATIESLAQASDVGFVVDEAQLPVPAEVSAVCEFLDTDALAMVMGDSVDFQLAFTVAERDIAQLEATFAGEGLGFVRIGSVTAGKETLLRRSSGELVPLPGEGWRHAPEGHSGSSRQMS